MVLTTTTTSCEHWCGWIALRCDLEQGGQSGKTVPTYVTRPGSGCTDNRSRFRDLDTTKYGPTTLERDPRRTARGGRFLRGRRDDNRTRWSNRHPGGFYITDDGQEVIEENEGTADIIAGSTSFPTHLGYRAVREDLNVKQRSPEVSLATDEVQVAEIRGPRMKRFSIQQLKLRTRCARCRKLGHWARECPEGNRGQRNDERYDRRAVRQGGVHHCSKANGTKTFLSRRFLDIRHSRSRRSLVGYWCPRGLVGKQQLDKWCEVLAEHDLQVEWSQEKPESASGIGGTTKPIGVVYVPVGLAGCNGIVRFTVVEQDVTPPLPVGTAPSTCPLKNVTNTPELSGELHGTLTATRTAHRMSSAQPVSFVPLWSRVGVTGYVHQQKETEP